MDCPDCGIVREARWLDGEPRCGFCHAPLIQPMRPSVRWPPKSMVPKNLRRDVFERDRGLCRYCGDVLNEDHWHADHVLPWARGGPTTLANLVASCPRCNMAKHDKTAEEFALTLAIEEEA